ncbi:MAG: hypothetical protein JST02_14385 [Bacteroidetes bacterium]|nr:hypothetical protein [Bacteroidota bacterium]
MYALELSDRLAIDMLSRDVVLDELSDWSKSNDDRDILVDRLSSRLWMALEKFAAQKYVDQSRVYVSDLIVILRQRPGNPLFVAIEYLVRRHFVWRDRAMLRYENVLQTQNWLAKCNPIQPQCYLWAINAQTKLRTRRLRGLPDELRREFYSNAPSLPEVDEWNLRALRHLGLAEIHRHLNGSALPSVLWSYLLSAPSQVPLGELAGDVDRLDDKKLRALLHTASNLRSAILSKLLNGAGDVNDKTCKSKGESFGVRSARDSGWSKAVNDCLRNMYDPQKFSSRNQFLAVSGLPKYRDAAARLPHASDHPLSAERALLVCAFEYLQLNPTQTMFLAALYAYMVIQNLVWRALIKPREYAKGFDRFERYHSHFLRDVEKTQGRVGQDRYLDRLLQAQNTGGVRWVELRVVPASPEKGGPLLEARKLDRALNPPDLKKLFRSDNKRRELIGASRSGMTVGLVFHFIKRKEKKKPDYCRCSCRHLELRMEVRRQATAIGRLHRSQGLGRYVVGVDAAGPEIDAGPEVFAPAIIWLRSRPTLGLEPKWMQSARKTLHNFPTPLGLTYHVGEDFRHLLSGLRAVDEAIRFLEMSSGDRIGHGLALGVEYRLWCHRVGNIVAMPRGQRLDDLVWMRTRLGSANSGFSGYLFEVDKEIERLVREIYASDESGPDPMPTLQVLHEAWKMRAMDPLEVGRAWRSHAERSMPDEIAVHDSPKLMNKAYGLYHDYHFNVKQRRRYNELIKVSLSGDQQSWHTMVTCLQDMLLKDVVRKRIAIEINPTSNLCIGSLADMTEHPVFRWHPPEQSSTALRPNILVGSDDPGVFATELLFEYAALSRAAEERGATPREISMWLNELRETSRKFCFLDTRD